MKKKCHHFATVMDDDRVICNLCKEDITEEYWDEQNPEKDADPMQKYIDMIKGKGKPEIQEIKPIELKNLKNPE